MTASGFVTPLERACDIGQTPASTGGFLDAQAKEWPLVRPRQRGVRTVTIRTFHSIYEEEGLMAESAWGRSDKWVPGAPS
jgi:hypothetical protein